uniref:Uncharacterized protein n=1 Tax=uncultured Latescibacterota bacterium TaxID=199737 RepID=Q2Z0E6_9BACT|nr:hypothetical protein [uncultured Latescibacterota bacterium]
MRSCYISRQRAWCSLEVRRVGKMRQLGALAALSLLLLLVPSPAAGYGESFTNLVDVQTAHTLPRASYSLGVRVVPDGGVQTGFTVGVTEYVLAGVSYGAANIIGSGEPDWDNEIEFELKIRLAEEYDVVPGLAIGYDSRGHGAQTPEGGYEKASQGIYIAAAKTAPFSEFWQFHAGISRTLEFEKTDPDFFLGVSGRLSQEFSVLAEYQLGATRDDDGSADKTGYLNAGLRWVFAEQVEIDLYFRNLVGPSGSPERSSRALSFVFYDSF